MSTFDHPELVRLGRCDLIEEVLIGEDSLIRFSGVGAGEACTIVLRGSSSHLLEEAERSLHDALCVLTETVKDTRVVYGGGCMEVRRSRDARCCATGPHHQRRVPETRASSPPPPPSLHACCALASNPPPSPPLLPPPHPFACPCSRLWPDPDGQRH